MPHTLTLTYRPLRLRAHARVRDGQRRVRALADAAVASFVTLWSGLFLDARTALPRAALTEAVAQPQILQAAQLVSDTWQTAVEVPARRLLPVLATTLVEDAATAMQPQLSALAGQPVRFVTGLPETQQAIDTYVGTQIRDISTTTMRAVRQVLMDGWQTNRAAATVAQEVEQMIGLTPQQVQTLAKMRTTLEAEGKTARQVRQALEQARLRGLEQRAARIAGTQTVTISELGEVQAWGQAVRAGAMDATRIRRFWMSEDDSRVCPICIEIPGMNPSGVSVDEPFQTPIGPVMIPTIHPWCRCDVDYSYV